jgi:proA: glutamate-5-semialdehyde dehydrogenase
MTLAAECLKLLKDPTVLWLKR